MLWRCATAIARPTIATFGVRNLAFLAGIAAAATSSHAQWTITYIVDEQQAAFFLTEARVPAMLHAVDRAKIKFEKLLMGSTGTGQMTLNWEIFAGSTVADSQPSATHITTPSIARNKLLNRAVADDESNAEILLYESLPATTVPFRYEADTVLFSSGVAAVNSLNKHLAFQPTINQNDGVFRFRPPRAWSAMAI